MDRENRVQRIAPAKLHTSNPQHPRRFALLRRLQRRRMGHQHPHNLHHAMCPAWRIPENTRRIHRAHQTTRPNNQNKRLPPSHPRVSPVLGQIRHCASALNPHTHRVCPETTVHTQSHWRSLCGPRV